MKNLYCNKYPTFFKKSTNVDDLAKKPKTPYFDHVIDIFLIFRKFFVIVGKNTPLNIFAEKSGESLEITSNCARMH